MKVEIRAIRESGVTNKERLVLKVMHDDDIGYYAVFNTALTEEGQVSNSVRHAYWFPDKKVSAGDLVVLYTKSGVQTETKNENGTTSHFFYWGLDKNIWHKKRSSAVLLHIDNWKSKIPD